MNKTFLIHGLAYKEDYSYDKSKAIVDTFFGDMADALIKRPCGNSWFRELQDKELPWLCRKEPQNGERDKCETKKNALFQSRSRTSRTG